MERIAPHSRDDGRGEEIGLCFNHAKFSHFKCFGDASRYNFGVFINIRTTAGLCYTY